MINEENPISIPETTKLKIADEYYFKFFNQTANGDVEDGPANAKNRSSRAVFEKDWQRFLWAFILGINDGSRTKLPSSSHCKTPFGFDVFKNRQKMLKVIFGLCLQEQYKNNPSQLKDDFEASTANGDNLGTSIRVAIEEYANTGFAIMKFRDNEVSGYIENMDEIVSDILK